MFDNSPRVQLAFVNMAFIICQNGSLAIAGFSHRMYGGDSGAIGHEGAK